MTVRGELERRAPSIRARVAWSTLLIAGCGTATPTATSDTTPHDVAPTSAATQRFDVAIGQSVVVAGETLTLSGWTEPEGAGAPFGVTLRREDREEDAIDVWSPGCTRDGGWVWTLDALDTGEPGGHGSHVAARAKRRARCRGASRSR